MNELLDSVYNILKTNKETIESGRINGIPFPFKQMHDCVPILQHGDYHLITAKTKHGSI